MLIALRRANLAFAISQFRLHRISYNSMWHKNKKLNLVPIRKISSYTPHLSNNEPIVPVSMVSEASSAGQAHSKRGIFGYSWKGHCPVARLTISATPAKAMINTIIHPRTLLSLELMNRPMMSFLFAIMMINAISGGATRPFKAAE